MRIPLASFLMNPRRAVVLDQEKKTGESWCNTGTGELASHPHPRPNLLKFIKTKKYTEKIAVM